MNSTPIFRCIQVRSMDDAVNEIAYHTSVKIGGHVFSGLLYDQGPDDEGDTSTGPNLDHPQQNLSLLFNASTQTHRDDGATRALLLSASNDQPSFTPHYPFPFAPFRPGIPYFSQPRP
ncbi:hypothetical protein RIF29_13092 [Crotalaria pallida]|uniref:Uncharacterized protein n=1 Tax=Crotalaria pallida TaxID=3830 RepID=A0AAN9INV7_CROPI